MLFPLLRLGTNLVTILFFIVGVVITQRVKAMGTETEYEHSVKIKQRNALKSLWIVIITFSITNLIMLIIDLYSSFYDLNCDQLLGDLTQIQNMIYMILHRFNNYYVWMWPIIWIFWWMPHRSRKRSADERERDALRRTSIQSFLTDDSLIEED